MMLFWIDVDGEKVAIQAVNRKSGPYYRLAPYTLVYPTPRQRKVRETLTRSAHEQAGKSLEDINRAVQEGFADWEYTKRPPNKLYVALKEMYGGDADSVLQYMEVQNRVRKKLRQPEYAERLRRAVNTYLQAEA